MEADYKFITSQEFVQFVESQSDIWPLVIGTIVDHAKFGSGKIKAVQQRNGANPQLIIEFSSALTTYKFNYSAFETGIFTNLLLSDELLDLLTEWREQIAIENTRVAAAEAAQKKIIQKKKVVGRKKRFFTEPTREKINVPRSHGSKSMIDTVIAEYKTQARSMSRTQLQREIQMMQHKAKVRPSEKLNLRLTTFKSVLNKLGGPSVWPIRVATTS